MNNSKALFEDFLKQISLSDSREESRSVAFLVFENIFGLSRTEILTGKYINSSAEQQLKLHEIAHRINNHEPVQYILGEAEFCGRMFKVNRSVLIPRPETEELVRLAEVILAPKKNSGGNIRILDIGTGSGCISISLSLNIPGAKVFASDVSEEALRAAKLNAGILQADVTFVHHNVLDTALPFHDLDLIISNPPYITLQEKEQMMMNVVDYEPHLALFVADDDPLLFYRAIASKAKHALKRNGVLLVEINAQFGDRTKVLLHQHGFTQVEIMKDLSGKDRIVMGLSSP